MELVNVSKRFRLRLTNNIVLGQVNCFRERSLVYYAVHCGSSTMTITDDSVDQIRVSVGTGGEPLRIATIPNRCNIALGKYINLSILIAFRLR